MNQRPQLARQGEDDVEVSNRQHALRARSNPLLLREPLAFGAMSIAAGVIDRSLEAAVAAHLEMAAERSRTTELDRRKYPALGVRQVMMPLELGAVRSDDISHLERWPPGGCRAVRHVGSACLRQPLQWTFRLRNQLLADPSVAHRRLDVVVTQQYLDHSEFLPAVEQMGRERVPQNVWCHLF